MTDLPTDVIRIRRFRLIDCQAERSPLMSQLEASAGISPDLAAVRAKARRRARARNQIADGYCDLVEEDGIDGANAWLRRLLDGEDKAS